MTMNATPTVAAPTVLAETRGAVEWLTLNRPERLNAFDEATAWALCEHFTALVRRRDIRVVVLRGAGRAFCAGVDLAADAPPVPSTLDSWNAQRAYSAMIQAMRRCPQPILGVLHGAVVGGGFSLALACDLRIGTPDLKMIPAFMKVGLTGGDIGCSWHLPRIVGRAAAADLLLRARSVDAARALQLGLVSDIVEPAALEATAQTICDEMLVVSPFGLEATKQCLDLAESAGSLEAAMALEDRQQALAASSHDFAEGVAAFQARRPPRFTGR